MIKLVVNIHTAWILLKNQVTNYDRMKTQLASIKKTLFWSSGTTIRDGGGSELLKVADDADRLNTSIIDIDENDDDEETIDESVNFFVRISFMGATVTILCYKIDLIEILNGLYVLATNFSDYRNKPTELEWDIHVCVSVSRADTAL